MRTRSLASRTSYHDGVPYFELGDWSDLGLYLFQNSGGFLWSALGLYLFQNWGGCLYRHSHPVSSCVVVTRKPKPGMVSIYLMNIFRFEGTSS